MVAMLGEETQDFIIAIHHQYIPCTSIQLLIVFQSATVIYTHKNIQPTQAFWCNYHNGYVGHAVDFTEVSYSS